MSEFIERLLIISKASIELDEGGKDEPGEEDEDDSEDDSEEDDSEDDFPKFEGYVKTFNNLIVICIVFILIFLRRGEPRGRPVPPIAGTRPPKPK